MIRTKAARLGAHSLVMLALTGFAGAAPARALPPAQPVADSQFAEDILAAIEDAESQVKAEAVWGPVPAPAPQVAQVEPEAVEEPADVIAEGEASYYGFELAGNRTASGERFNPRELTAAHRTLPLGTKLRVVNMTNGRSVVVRVNDRGPFVKHRIIDVSYGAAQEIGMVRAGKAKVRLERIS